jgi:hypothetical protein
MELPSPTVNDDEASIDDQSNMSNTATTAATNSATAAFPFKLRDMLNTAEREGFSHIVSWELNGQAFKVHRPVEFVSDVMPNFFRQTKLKSFQRQVRVSPAFTTVSHTSAASSTLFYHCRLTNLLATHFKFLQYVMLLGSHYSFTFSTCVS